MKPADQAKLEVALTEKRPILTEIDLLVSESARRVSVDEHLHFRRSLLKPLDEVDELLEEIRFAEFEEKGARP